VVQSGDVNDRVNLKSQYQQQVFQPDFSLPTMSIEDLADYEVEMALERQRQQEEAEARTAAEDPESEEVLERERQKDARMDDWKDWNPKGSGNTQRM
jgi:immunoglobulin-binding protein 1